MKVDREDMLHLFNVNVAGVARVTEVCGVLRPGNTGGKVSCDWWRAAVLISDWSRASNTRSGWS